MNEPARRWRDDVLIVVALVLLAASLALGGWAWRLDRVAYDWGLTLWSRPPPSDIVIVAIDDASVAAIGRWPWRRAVHATLLHRLAEAQPKAIALDIVFSEIDPDPQQDRLLAEAFRRAAPVVVPVAWQFGQQQPLAALEPAAPLREAVTLGAAEAPVDSDGVLRYGFLRAGPAGALYPHLAVALLQAGGDPVHAGVRAETEGGEQAASSLLQGGRREGRLLIRYTGAPGTIERVSYADVLSGAVPKEQLAGRYVLVGMTALGLGDTLATPVNGRHQAMPGVEAHANFLYTLKSGDTITPLSDGTTAVLAAVLLTALLVSFRYVGARRALPTALLSVPLALLASLLALRAGVWCSPVPYVLPAALAYPLWSWRRLERAVAGLDSEIGRLAAEPLVARAMPPAVPGRPGADAIETRLQTLQSAGQVVRQAREFLADALAAMPTAMLVADGQARVLLANERAAALFEVESAEELNGLDLLRLLGEFRTAEPVDWQAALQTLAPEGLAAEGAVATGSDCVLHLARVQAHGLVRLIVTVADIAPVKQAQREREQALAFVSHDLRSPASSIVMLADLHLQGRQVMDQNQLLHEMRRLAASTLALSEDFVRAAQVQTRPLQREAVAPAALVEAAIADLRAQALAEQVPLQATLEDAEAPVVVDRLLLVRAIANLVSNAIKHSPPGQPVQVRASSAGGALKVQVRDHGTGLSPEQLEQLQRGDEGARVHDARGVGLGLLFVQRVARRHGGTLQARNAPGGGALFELHIPA